SDSSLEMVNDVVMDQSALGRLLDYGNVRIITGADIGVNTFRYIAHPIRFKIAMLEQKSRLGGFPAPEDDEVMPVDIPDVLARLGELQKQGLITQEEFEQEKKQLLERLR
ncbi:MAG: SHOCT domain-containing protein, partial [Anaerolineae bacterium]|nr:SHOCT domain-containing protein [Anaerolineae bacterium]